MKVILKDKPHYVYKNINYILLRNSNNRYRELKFITTMFSL